MNKLELQLNKIHCGDNREVMKTFPADSVDLVVTSPPYWGLRDYGTDGKIWGGDSNHNHVFDLKTIPQRGNRDQDFNERWGNSPGQKKQEKKNIINCKRGFCECGAWNGQLGMEPHPQLFVNHLVEIFQEVKRILKPSGSFWLNLGDTYYGSGKGAGGSLEAAKEVYMMDKSSVPKQNLRSNWLQPKQKLMMPHRVAIALQDDGWILRNDIIWYKRNHMPEPVQDRLTKSYENFFFFVKSRKYYFDLDSIRIPSITNENRPHGVIRDREYNYDSKMGHLLGRIKTDGANTGDNNKPPYSSNNPHKQRLIDGKEAGHKKGKNPGDMWSIPTHPFPGSHFAVFPPKLITPIIKAACPVDGVVLDPFAGSGTALRVARKLGRKFIGIELNPEYAEMCEARVRGDKYKPPPKGVPKLSTFSKKERTST